MKRAFQHLDGRVGMIVRTNVIRKRYASYTPTVHWILFTALATPCLPSFRHSIVTSTNDAILQPGSIASPYRHPDHVRKPVLNHDPNRKQRAKSKRPRAESAPTTPPEIRPCEPPFRVSVCSTLHHSTEVLLMPVPHAIIPYKYGEHSDFVRWPGGGDVADL